MQLNYSGCTFAWFCIVITNEVYEREYELCWDWLCILFVFIVLKYSRHDVKHFFILLTIAFAVCFGFMASSGKCVHYVRNW